ncbi:MAG: hypothetical protein AAGD86_09970, partial [Pseudomonadota bacterium]
MLRLVAPAALPFLAAGALWLPSLAAAEVRPKMHVEFVFETDLFDGMTDTEKQMVAEGVRARVIADAGRRWGYLDWVADAAPEDAAVPRWQVRLEAEELSVTMGDGQVITDSQIYLRHYAVLDGAHRRLWEAPSEDLLYDLTDSRPLNNPPQLLSELETRLTEQLNTLLSNQSVGTALGGVPISDVIVLDPGKSRIMLPMRLIDLRAGKNTVFRVGLRDETLNGARFRLKESGSVAEL